MRLPLTRIVARFNRIIQGGVEQRCAGAARLRSAELYGIHSKGPARAIRHARDLLRAWWMAAV